MEYIPGLAGVPATKSSISNIDGAKGILSYRGYSIEDLVQFSNFEEVAYLLHYKELPNKKQLAEFNKKLNANMFLPKEVVNILKQLPKTTHPMFALQAGLASLAAFYPGYEFMSGDDDREYMEDVSLKLIGHIATIVAAWERIRADKEIVEPKENLSYAANFLYMLNAEESDAKWVALMDACLVLHAEHTVNASTFTVMVTSSSRTNPCSAIAAGVASLAGPMHGAANQKVLEMLQEIGSLENVKPYLQHKLDHKELIWGMGHREYSTKDPRAKMLEKMIKSNIIGSAKVSYLFDIAIAVEEFCLEEMAHKGIYPNVDFYSGILYQEMGFKTDSFTSIFAVSRTTGWVSHWLEQMEHNKIFRPAQIYIGEDNKSYLPIDKR